jgi:hypothetical protein
VANKMPAMRASGPARPASSCWTGRCGGSPSAGELWFSYVVPP